MRETPYELIAMDANVRSEFYRLCEKRIRLLKQHGFITEAVIHANALRSIKADLDVLAEYD